MPSAVGTRPATGCPTGCWGSAAATCAARKCGQTLRRQRAPPAVSRSARRGPSGLSSARGRGRGTVSGVPLRVRVRVRCTSADAELQKLHIHDSALAPQCLEHRPGKQPRGSGFTELSAPSARLVQDYLRNNDRAFEMACAAGSHHFVAADSRRPPLQSSAGSGRLVSPR